MSSQDQRGAVAGLRNVQNPIDLARCVMAQSPHVFLMGVGAERFARAQGFALVDPGYFITELQTAEPTKAIQGERLNRVPTGRGMSGTVGAVAVDSRGDQAVRPADRS